MGSWDSGWWGGTHGRMLRRTRVDECEFVFTIEGFRAWMMNEEIEEPVVLEVAWCDDGISFEHVDITPRCERERPRKPGDWCLYVDIEPHAWPVYGTRWFFRCVCNRLCDRLYALRPEGPIQCRICHKLSYASAQEYSIFKRTGRGPITFGRMNWR